MCISPVNTPEDVPINGNPHGRRRDTAFDQLVLPPGHKEMVKSLIAQHFRDKRRMVGDLKYWDFVRGKGMTLSLHQCVGQHTNRTKGKGLIILLHGAPGVGKTTTAG